MKRLLALVLATLALNACEKHEAADLPEEFRNRGQHDAKAEPAPDHGSAPSGATSPSPH